MADRATQHLRRHSDSSVKLLIVMGTRPEIIKLAPVVRQAKQTHGIETVVVQSGQHDSLAEPMLRYFDITPDEHYESTPGASLNTLSSRFAAQFGELTERHRPDVVIVQGDTITCSAFALASFYCQVPLIHVEAGLRTHSLAAPWPEEFNRRITAVAATLHCAATHRAKENLLSEGVVAEDVLVTGNTVIDSLTWALAKEGISLTHRQTENLVLITAHRRENFGEPMRDICRAVAQLSEEFPSTDFFFVTHPNPNAGAVAKVALQNCNRVEVMEHLDYPAFVRLMARARLIISDSGGIQEEAPSLGVPVLVTRESTERPEAVACGISHLVGTAPSIIVENARKLLRDDAKTHCRPVNNPFGDGHAGARIIAEAARRFGG